MPEDDRTRPLPRGANAAEDLHLILSRIDSMETVLREIRAYMHGTPSAPGLVTTIDRMRETIAHESAQTDVEVATLSRRVDSLEHATLGTPERSGLIGRVIALEASEATRSKHMWALWAAVLAGGAKAIADAIAGR